MTIIKDLTTKQTTILEFIKNRIVQDGKPPTIRELGRHFGFKSTGTTRDHLRSLVRKGYIKLIPRQARSIELVRPLALRVPVLGRITAGSPNLAFEDAESYLFLNEFLSNSDRQIFALKIQGDSLVDKGIFDGDLAIVKKQRLAEEGDVVAALLEQEATIKILKKEGAQFYLAAANKLYPDIHKPFTVIGKVMAVIRKFS